MLLYITLIHILAFFLLCPGILVSLPAKGSKYVVAGVHAVIFGLLAGISHYLVIRQYKPRCNKCGDCSKKCGCNKEGLCNKKEGLCNNKDSNGEHGRKNTIF